MPKRFTATEKWDDGWFLSLDNDWRIIWQYSLDRCTNGGRFKKNFKLMNFCCNTNVSPADYENTFNGRVIDRGDYYFIPKFLKFQYPKGLNSGKPAIQAVRKELIEYNLTLIIRESLGNDYLMIKETDKEKEKEKETEKDIRQKPMAVKKTSKAAFTPPTIEEVRAYCVERKNTVDPGRFIDFYEAKGWRVGKNKMKDWKAALRNAESWCFKQDRPRKREEPKLESIPVNPEEQAKVSEMISKTLASMGGGKSVPAK